jgi:hypothetical protein
MMDYPNTGLLFTNNRRVNENAPHMNGEMKFERDFLMELVKKAEGEEVVLKLSAWLKKDKNGNRMVSLKTDVSDKPKATQKDPWDD